MCQELSPLGAGDAGQYPYSVWASKREQYLSALAEVQRRLLAFRGEGRCYEDVLEPLGVVSGASRVYVFENHRDESGRMLMSQKAEWCAKGVKPEIDNPLLQNYPYDDYAARLLKGEILTGIVRNLPDFVRAVLEPQGILTILLIPLFVNGEPFGFIGFDNCAEEREWEPPEIDLLRAAAGAISLAIERQRAEEQAKRLAAELEKRVEERTRALKSANEALRTEIVERERAESERARVAAEADRARAFLQAAINTIPVGIILSDAEGVVILSNSTAVSMLGEDPTGRSPGDDASSSFVFRGYNGEIYSGFQRILKVLRSGRAFGPVEHLIQRSDGTKVTALTSITPVFDSSGKTTGTVVALADVTALKDRERELTSALRKAEEGSRLLQALMEYIPEGVLVASAPDGNLIMASRAAAAMIGCSVQELLAMSVQQRRCAFDVRYPDGREVPEGKLPLVRAIRSGEVVEGEEYLIPTRGGKRIHILCNAGPIRDSEGRIIAGVLVYRDFTELRQAQEELQRAFDQEKHVSATLQKAFLPNLPRNRELHGFIAEGRYQPAYSSVLVGGDFYDVFSISEGKYGIAMGDVAGKGVEAAVRTALVKYSLRAYSRVFQRPSDILAAVNSAFLDAYGAEHSFITLFYGIFEPDTGRLRYANAGHEPPLIVTPDGLKFLLHSTGPTLGSFEDAVFATQEVTVPENARLLLYTDGVTDAHRPGGPILGVDEVAYIVSANEDPSSALDKLLQRAQEHAGGYLRDDAALLLVQRTGK